MVSRFQVIEVTDLRTRAKSYKVYERPAGSKPAVLSGLPTRDAAEAKIRELEVAPAGTKP